MRFARLAAGEREIIAAWHEGAWYDLTAGYELKTVAAALKVCDESGLDKVAFCPPVSEQSLRFLPPVDADARILCAGFNYRDHAAEVEREEPQYPTFFTRFASSLVGTGEPLVLPQVSSWLDWEGELAVVIGRSGRRLTRENAQDHVAGYVCFGDHSLRDYQLHGTQATAGKNFDASGAIGPWIVTADEVSDPRQLEVFTFLNGEQVQHGLLADLIFDIPALLVYVSSFMQLRPGDVIATGTPAGIGGRRKPPRWLTPGDEIVVEVPGIGRLANTITPEIVGEAA